jgi:hypothetical protein
MTDYYIDTKNGNDEWDGLAAKHVKGTKIGPWKSILPSNFLPIGDDTYHTNCPLCGGVEPHSHTSGPFGMS